jgi:hypothetical protein
LLGMSEEQMAEIANSGAIGAPPRMAAE